MKTFFKPALILFPCIFLLAILKCSSQVYTQQWIAAYGNDSSPATYIPVELYQNNGFIYSLSTRDSCSHMKTVELAKYHVSGNCLWRQIYASQDSQHVEASCITGDNAGNIYVGGYEWVQNEGYNYLVLKYDPSGNLLWTFHRNGPKNESDFVYAITADADGNCYVSGAAGLSGDPYFYTDALTCKIDSSGNLLWERYYNYPMDSLIFDETRTLMLNSNNDLILAGHFNDDLGVCKYDSAGNLIWTSQPIAFSTFAATLDDSSNIFLSKNESGNSALTVKLDSSGIVQWTSTIPYPSSTLLQSLLYLDGSVYAAGYRKPAAASRYDVFVIKYDINGDTSWTRLYNPPADVNDYGGKIKKGQNNSLVIAGFSGSQPDYNLLVLNFDTSGNLLWSYENTDTIYSQIFVDALVDTTGSIILSSNTKLYTVSNELVSISNAGIFQWNDFRENLQDNEDFSKKIIMDSGGNPVVAGISNSRTWSQDVYIIKYDPAGTPLWENRMTQNTRSHQSIMQLITNMHDEIYFCGSADTFWNADDEKLLVGKIDQAGATQWIKRFDDTLASRHLGSSIAWHPDGFIYVLGYSLFSNGLGKETYLLKLDSLGNQVWKKTIADSSLADNGECLVFDSTWNLYAAYRGIYNGQSMQSVCKLDTAGTILWTQRYSGPGFGAETPKKILIDHSQNVILTGFSDSLSWDMVVIKYDMNGNYQWHYRYEGPGGNWDIPNDMAIDEFDNIYVTGESDDINNYSDCFTFKLDAAGNLQWESRYAGTYVVPVDVGTAIAVGHGGRTIVTGNTYDTNGIRKTLLLVYDSLGSTIYTELFFLPGGYTNDEFGSDVICDPNGSFYITGQTDSWENRTDFITIKYTDLVLSSGNIENLISSFTSYPNPFTGSFEAAYYSEHTSSGTYSIYNSMGEKVAEKKIKFEKGKNQLRFSEVEFKPGIYFISLKLDSGEFLSKKMISLR